MSVTSPPLTELQIASLRLLIKFGWGQWDLALCEEAHALVCSALGLSDQVCGAEAMALLPIVSREVSP